MKTRKGVKIFNSEKKSIGKYHKASETVTASHRLNPWVSSVRSLMFSTLVIRTSQTKRLTS